MKLDIFDYSLSNVLNDNLIEFILIKKKTSVKILQTI